jgi:hypothetical protein
VVPDRIPLDSPLWHELSACYSTSKAVALLRQVLASRQLGEAWQGLCDEILHQGTAYQMSSAVIPHLVDLAPALSLADRREVWGWIGFLVTLGAGRFESPPAPSLQDGLDAALRVALGRAVLDFVTDTPMAPQDAIDSAMACVALTGHEVGRAMWEDVRPASGYVPVSCPLCDSEDPVEVDGFGDPFAPPATAPVVGPAIGTAVDSWRPVADAIGRLDPEESLGPGWSDILATGAWVAAHGLPASTPNGAVWCLVCAMLATTSQSVASWARTVARLAGHFHCLECDSVWAIADILGRPSDEEPMDLAHTADPDTQLSPFLVNTSASASQSRVERPERVADAVAGFPAADGRRPARVQAATARASGLRRSDDDPDPCLRVSAGPRNATRGGCPTTGPRRGHRPGRCR